MIKILEEKAVEKDIVLPLKENIASLEYQMKAAKSAHNEWQPSKVKIYDCIILLVVVPYYALFSYCRECGEDPCTCNSLS